MFLNMYDCCLFLLPVARVAVWWEEWYSWWEETHGLQKDLR